jgi:periplasmic protein TonB
MALKKTKKQDKTQWKGPAIVLLVFAGLIGLMLKTVLSESGAKPQKQVQVISLIKPPPEVKEKLPEPEVPKEAPKQAMEAPSQAPAPQDSPAQDADDSPPAGDNLAVDGDGGAGDNAFGLGAKKGGRGITLGGTGGGGGSGLSRLSLLSKYSGYSHKMQSDIEKKVKQVLEKEGGRPKGKQQTLIKLTLGPDGSVLKFAIVGSSGVDRLDAAFRVALNGLKLSEPPPEGMPGSMTLRITTSG